MDQRDSKHQLIAAHQKTKERDYWLEKLSGELTNIAFPYDYRKANQGCGSGSDYADAAIPFGAELMAGLTKLSKGSDYTLHIILTAALTALITRYTPHRDIILGTPIYRQDTDQPLINTALSLRQRVEEKMTFKELLLQVRQTLIEADEHQNYPLEVLARELKVDGSGDNSPLWDIAILLENVQDKRYLHPFKPRVIFSFLRTGDRLEGVIHYHSRWYEKSFMEGVARHYLNLLGASLGNLDVKIAALDLLSGEEKEELLVKFNRTGMGYPREKSLHRLFQEQVRRTPAHTASSDDAGNITYHRLHEKSRQLAYFLKQRGIGRESIVGIMLEPSIATIITLLGILEAGGAYLPIDTPLPWERVRYMLEDSGAAALVTDSGVVGEGAFTRLRNLEANRDFRVRLTAPRPPVNDFDTLPRPDRSLIDLRKYKGRIGMASATDCISLQATRGCPYECFFCHKVWSKRHVFRSAENIFSEVEYYYRRGVRNFAFIDDCFNLHRGNSQRFFQLLSRGKLDLQLFFPNGLRGDILTAEDIDCMVEAGMRGINLSLETASPRLQKLIKKNLDIDRFKKNIDYIAAQHPGVILEIATMHGFPTESEEEAMMTLDFIKGIRWLHFPYIHILKIYPNTEMEALALEHGVSKREILASRDLAFHELPGTLPFPRSFTRQYQSDFMNHYFLSKNRLRHVLPVQMRILSPQALAQKYNTYLPVDIHHLEDVLSFVGLEDLSLPRDLPADTGAGRTIFDAEPGSPPIKPSDTNKSSQSYSNKKFLEVQEPFFKKVPGRRRQLSTATGKLLLLDLSQHFSSRRMLYNVTEQPLGLISLLTYLKRELGNRVDGRIYKAGIDFDSFAELKSLIDAYKPDLVGIRTLTFYKEFFHETVSLLRQWGVSCPLIAGGPYATSDYDTILKDRNVDLVVLGEGEYTFKELVQEMLDNGFIIPGQERLAAIAGIAYVSCPGAAGGTRDHAVEVLLLDRLKSQLEHRASAALPGNGTGSGSHLAYVMYTSGSTGRPKGVMVEHSQVNNCLSWMQAEFNLTGHDTVVHRTNLTFDPSVWEIFWPLAQGGNIRVLSADQRKDADFLIDLLTGNGKDPGLTVMYCPASLVLVMTRLLRARVSRPLLKLPWLIIGAEPIAMETVKEFYSYFAGKIVNTYGPTEGTINNTWYELDPGDKRDFVPIGQPVGNNQVYILAGDLQLLPVNVPGEICIAGDSVARGYINNMDKTARLFRDNPFGSGKLYRTGDIGCWLEDGNIEIMGRLDNQVKIRGYRIETGEIEGVLSSHPQVNQCVVVVKDKTKGSRERRTCKKCGITTLYPGVKVDEEEYCEMCRDSHRSKSTLDAYFKNPEDLRQLILETNSQKRGKYDCLLLYSGGRGSAYALYQLVDMGFNVLAATYDNGYFSTGDLKNIREITAGLGVDHVVLSHENSDKILAESMRVASTVCRGCFHTSSSLAGEYAYRNGINPVVGATLSRGQIIENKLSMFLRQGISDPAELEREIAGIARSAPDIDRTIFNYIDIDVIEDRRVHDTVKFVDFYRYYDISNREMLAYLDRRDPYWQRRKYYAIYSTNCPVKQMGDYGHLEEQGYHYYGSATSWERRLGHLGLENLEEDLKIRVTANAYDHFIKRIGYQPVKRRAKKPDPGGKGDRYLCAYVVAGDDLDLAELRESLSQRLAGYMIPSYFVRLDSLPLAPNGKIDRKALPEPETTMTGDYTAPADEVERKLAEIWGKELGLERIGVSDNFFTVGGDSIKAIMVTSQIHREMEVKIQLADIFKMPTIKELAGLIQDSGKKRFASIPGVEEKEYYELTNAQQRMWTIQQVEETRVASNVHQALVFEGELQPRVLARAFDTVSARHESLRTTFIVVNSEPRQKIHPPGALAVQMRCLDLRESEGPEKRAEEMAKREVNSPFDLEKGPLLRTTLLQIEARKYLLLCTMHHIIADAWSIQVIANEMIALYNARGGGEGNLLPPLRIQYKDYTAWQNRQFSAEKLEQHRKYWLEQFSGQIPLLELPIDFPRAETRTFRGSQVKVTLDQELTGNLKTFSREKGVSLFMTLSALVKTLLYSYTDQTDIVIGTPISGREHVELENQVGFYLNTLALRTCFAPGDSFIRLVEKVKEIILAAYEHKAYPFDRLVKELAAAADPGRNPLFDVMVVFQTRDTEIRLAERLNQDTGDPLRISEYKRELEASALDLNFSFYESGEELALELHYNSDLYHELSAALMGEKLVQLARDIIEDTAKPLKELEAENLAVEKVEILDEWDLHF